VAENRHFPLTRGIALTTVYSLTCYTMRQVVDVPDHVSNAVKIRDSKKSSIIANKKSTMGFPTSYRWSAYIAPKSRKGGSKSDFRSLE